MERILTPELMAAADLNCQNKYLDGLILMERAALAAFDILMDQKNGFNLSRILILAGPGNNGADALCLGRLLYEIGIDSDIYAIGNLNKTTDSFKKQQQILKEYGKELINNIPDDMQVHEYTTIVDGLFGISLNRDIEGEFLKAVKYINACRESYGFMVKVLALDVPSGINGLTGKVMGEAVNADITVTFGYKKIGTLLYPGAQYCGELILKKIGIPESVIPEKGYKGDFKRIYSYEPEEVRLPDRPAYSNKGTFGKVLLIAGNKDICGAAILSGLAAMRTGAGMLKIVTAQENRETICKIFPEAMISCYAGELLPLSSLEKDLKWCDVLAIGPGIGTDATAHKLVEFAINQDQVPVVMDADALNILSEHLELLNGHLQDIVITPHVGEMSRLTGLGVGEITGHLLDTACDFAKNFDVTVVLKDARTVTSEPTGKCYINLYGNSGMATAGSGDVLTGIIAALIAGGMQSRRAASLGVCLHAKAGDKALQELSKQELLARNIIENI